MNLIVRPGLTIQTFESNDQDQTSSSYYYFGFSDKDGNWIIQRFDNTVSNIVSYRYASFKNNTSYTKYTDAWTNRASLTYGYFYQI